MQIDDTILDRILARVRGEIEAAKAERSLAELQAMQADAPPLRSFHDALAQPFGIIAEIKERSPSKGAMRAENVAEAPGAYDANPLVRAVSVLTNQSDFGMSPQRLLAVKQAIGKPVLRKDFIIDPYQVHEARAFGADALLLMTQRLSRSELSELHALATGLGMHCLVECQTGEQLEKLPEATRIIGINSRNLLATEADFQAAREARERQGIKQDSTTEVQRFEIISELPAPAIKIAESGITPSTIAYVRDLGYHAALIGTDLLLNEAGVAAGLAAYEGALAG